MIDDKLPALVAVHEKKLWLLGGVLAVAGIGFLFTDEIAIGLGVAAVVIQLSALGLTCGSLVMAFLLIRCPNCGLRLVLYALSHRSMGGWLQWLLTEKTCPRCGYSHEGPGKS
jgi:predicted RNA-binding Zn-ribbon protein involved in translation (DUF1610 family)